MYNNISNQYFFESGGHTFESEVADILTAFARQEWGFKSVKFSTKKEDRFEGTDLFVLGIPVDVTLAFADKNKTRWLGKLSIDGVTIDFGLRTGNGKSQFKKPVLVIGAETAVSITKSNMWYALSTIKANIKKILDFGMDEYLFATES